ncbi:hypothetical protein VTO42DRAFT_1799 [Malbranchea cinnamomea]
MFRPASRTILRHVSATQQLRIAHAKRLVSSSAQSEKKRSWKSTVVRWGLAIGAVYYYNTSSVFAEEPQFALQPISSQANENAPLPTIESVSAAKKQKAAALAASRKPKSEPEPAQSPTSASDDDAAASSANAEVAPTQSQSLELTPGELEEEADQQGAFDPETGEINWDCPCLGGMAHGPCGEEFKSAFSCFVYSTEEPKGMDCIDKFKAMQDCFRLHPDVYGSELDEEEVDQQLEEHIAAEGGVASAAATETSASGSPVDVEAGHAALTTGDKQARESEPEQVRQEVEKELHPGTKQAPEKWHDATHQDSEVESK